MNERFESKRRIPSTTVMMAGVGLVAVLSLGGCGRAEADATPASEKDRAGATAPASQRAVRVEVATIGGSVAELDLQRPAEVEATKDASLAAAIGGYVEVVRVKSGERVKKGQILVYVDTATHAARREQTKVELEAARRELERMKKLGDAVAKANVDAASTRVKAAEAALTSVEVAARRAVIRAPFAGVIDKVFVEVGEVAPPGAPIARLLQLDPALVTVSVSDRDVLAIKPGMAATVSTDAIRNPIQGEVKRVRRAADTRTRAFEVEVEVPNGNEKLLPGMIASVRLASASNEKRIVIANDWLVTKPGEIGVFVADKSIARYRKVQVGSLIGNRVIIDKGLKMGDALVVTGHRELAEGDPLLISRQGQCCTPGGRVQFEMVKTGAKKAKSP